MKEKVADTFFTTMTSVFLLGFVWLAGLFICTNEVPLDEASDIDWRTFREERTTLNEDEWWFFTTKRPVISYKDFPGRPGVATWKEISPSSTTENRNSRKAKSPTAEEVSSGSWSPSSALLHSVPCVLLAAMTLTIHL